MNRFIRIENTDQLLKKLNSSYKCKIMAGGTDILINIKNKTIIDSLILDTSLLTDKYSFIKKKDNLIEIGSLTTFSEIAENNLIKEHLPQLKKALLSIGSPQIRNMATVGGNIVNASPAADSVVVLLTKDAKLNILSVNNTRTININNFYKGYKKLNLNKNEFITSIEVEINKEMEIFDFIKIGNRETLSISKVSLAYSIYKNTVRLASGSVNPNPSRLLNLEKIFLDSNLTKKDILTTLENDIEPIDDIRSTAFYRKTVLLNLLYSLKESLSKEDY